MEKIFNKVLSEADFDQLKNGGMVVPRKSFNGDSIGCVLGRIYTIVNPKKQENLKAKCTQINPFILKLIN